MPSVFPSESRHDNVPNELLHRAGPGPPFLDNHCRGYQYVCLELLESTITMEHEKSEI